MVDNDLQRNRLMARAKSAVLSRDFSVAKKIYEDLIAKDPSDYEALSELGSMYVKSGQDKNAYAVYSKILKENSKDVVALNEMGAIYRRLKEYDKSVDMLQRAVIVDETNIQSFYNLGFTYKIIGKYDSAIKAFERVLDVNPNDVLAYNHIGTIYAAKGDYSKAIEFYHRGLLIDTNHPVLHLNMAKSYEALGKKDNADMEFLQTLRIKPLWKDACIGYVDFLIDNERLEEADKILDKVINNSENIDEITERLNKIEKKRFQIKLENQENCLSIHENNIEQTNDNKSTGINPDVNELVLEEGNNNEENIQIDLSLKVDTESLENPSSFDLLEEKKESINLDEIKSDTVVSGFEDNSEFSMEKLTEDITDADDLFEQKLGDQIEADNQVIEGLDLLAPDSNDCIVEEIDEDQSIFSSKSNNFSSEDSNNSNNDIYIEEEEEEIVKDDEVIPLTIAEKPIDDIENTCSGPLLPVHKSEREQAYEDRQAVVDPKLGKTVDKAIDAMSDRLIADKYKKEVLLFQELSSLSQSLPKNERDYFKESKNNLQLEYLISKMSGKPGLLATSEEVRKMLDIEDDESVSKMDVEVNILAFKVLSQCRTMIKELPDKGLAIALDELVKGVLSKLY